MMVSQAADAKNRNVQLSHGLTVFIRLKTRCQAGIPVLKASSLMKRVAQLLLPFGAKASQVTLAARLRAYQVQVSNAMISLDGVEFSEVLNAFTEPCTSTCQRPSGVLQCLLAYSKAGRSTYRSRKAISVILIIREYSVDLWHIRQKDSPCQSSSDHWSCKLANDGLGYPRTLL